MSTLAFRLRTPSGRRSLAVAALGWAGFWLLVVVIAQAVVGVVAGFPLVAIAPAVLLAAVILSVRFPLFVFLVAAGVTGMYGTIEATWGFNPYLVMEGALLALWIAAGGLLFWNKGRGRPRLWPGVLVVAVVLASTAWFLTAQDPVAALGVWRHTYWFLLAAVLVAWAPFPAFSSENVARALLVAGMVGAGYAVLRWQIGPSSAEEAYAIQTGGPFNFFDQTTMRPVGGVGDGHALSAFMAAVIPFAFAMTLLMRDRWRLLAAATTAAAGTALVAAEVRAGMVAALVGMVVVIVLITAARSLGGGRLIVLYLGLIVCLGVVGSIVAFESGETSARSERIANILTPEEDPAFQERLYVWDDALAEVDSKPFGYGLGFAENLKTRELGYTADEFDNDVINSYLRVALEQGVIFAFVVIALILLLLLVLVQGTLGAPPGRLPYMIAAAATLTSFAINLNFESIYIAIAPALFAWLAVGLGLRQLSWQFRGSELRREAEPT